MFLFWFLAGALATIAALAALLPWLQSKPKIATLRLAPWQTMAFAAVIGVIVLVLYHWLGHPDATTLSAESRSTPRNAADGFRDAANALNRSSNLPAIEPGPAPAAGAGSMDSAVAKLKSRLATGGGSGDDWELLAKSFEFLGRPADALRARQHQLPAAAGSGTSVSGEVTLAEELRSRVNAGETIFIVAKSVDSPDIPVAVFRGSVDRWPLQFQLDDSQSMMAGRNLSSAGRVQIEARISQKGQPLPATGDLQGTTPAFDPAEHHPLKIVIDRVIQ